MSGLKGLKLNIDLCPTHNVEMEYEAERFVPSARTFQANVPAWFCPECKILMYNRITTLKLERSKWKSKSLWRGLK